MVVDLLVSLAYIALAEGAPDAPLPVGMGLRVDCRTAPVINKGPDGLFDFDRLDINDVWSLIPVLAQIATDCCPISRCESPLCS